MVDDGKTKQVARLPYGSYSGTIAGGGWALLAWSPSNAMRSGPFAWRLTIALAGGGVTFGGVVT